MVFPALPGVIDCFTVLAFQPEHFLILGWVSPGGTMLMTWAFVLDGEDRSTRLLVRARGGHGYRFHRSPSWLTTRFVPIVHFVMQRKQLLGIARRAEGQVSANLLETDRAFEEKKDARILCCIHVTGNRPRVEDVGPEELVRFCSEGETPCCTPSP